MVMASALEFSKLVAASYLKQAWDSIGKVLKIYLVLAVVILMIITSAGIFGYLSNAFQQQNLKIQQVEREVAVWEQKINTNKEQIEIFNTQLNNFQQNQGKIIDLQQGNSANSRLLRSVDNRDKQISETSQKIDVLQSEIVQYNDTINSIKNANIDIEREVGGFRFVADAFGVNLNTVVKFFILLIVFVFDPLAIALVIAFNNLIKENSEKKSVSNDEIRMYKVYGDDDADNSVNLSEKDLEIFEQTVEAPPIPNDALTDAV
jgi:cell division protein FtsB